jgi:O-antigen/teichoic acid export membrane protein
VRGGVALGALGGTAATQGVNLLTAMIVARALLPEGRGDLALVILWPMLAAQIVSLSLNEAVLVLAASGRGEPRRLLGSALAMTLALAVLGTAAAAGFALLPWALAARPDEVQAVGRLCLFLVPATLLSTLFLDALRGRHDQAGWLVLRVVQALAYAGGAMIAWTAEAGLAGFAAAFIVSHALAAAAAAWRLARREGLASPPRRRETRDLAALGLRLHAGFVVQVLGGRLDQIAIALLLDPAALGLYAVATVLLLGLLQLAASVTHAAFPRFVALDAGARSRAIRRTLALVLGGVALAGLALAALAPWLVRLLFGEAFAPAADLVRLALLGLVPHASREVFMAALKAEGRPLAIGRAELVSLAFFAASLALLVPRLGAPGAALAYAATQWLVAAVMTWQCREMLRR